MMATDLTVDLAEAVTGLLDMLDNKRTGLKASVLVRDNDCGCECCDDAEDYAEQIKTLLGDILDSAAAANARRILARYEWGR